MLRDFKFLRRNSSKKDEIENVPVNPDGEPSFRSSDLSIRPPLNAIQDPAPSPKPEQDASFRSRIDKTPSKPKEKQPDHALPRKTPDKNAMHSKYRFGWSAKNDPSDDLRSEMRAPAPVSLTPGVSRGVGRAYSGHSESVSTQSTPTKSVSKPPPSGFRSRIDGNGGARGANFPALYRGIPSSSGAAPVVNTAEVPHFDLKEDPSFWLDHNVQVIIRVRPLNNMEKSTQGYNRCLKQESGQSITWVGQQEARFTFDHVACETVDQEMLFRMTVLPMVENCLAGYNSCLFAYGQTGSGKTYTMLGETEELEVRPSPHRGMTPRIFEFLFARIQAEEESRRDEHLKYSCKCSFLEIYNEQITDLLDPSSTNLQLREDAKEGVYVENLSEFEVQTVSDILKLLARGSLNRKVAATNMNRESSRSHCVFTCVIESSWEKDSTTNLRFARLNLVDLAGSERQKTSGAEGERLKEAANINRSLSTLGHVIMILVDVANGRLRHVPYRDSKLTFLLQDSLGGNSKTMIIANVSPSICCAAETLNTLKFAQRARLIQNNAVINEDSTGDVIALKRQIQILKEELAALKRQSVSRCLTFGSLSIDSAEEDANDCINYDRSQQHVDKSLSKGTVMMSTKQLESLEAILAGSLRREQMAEMSMKKFDAEIEQLNRLVRQREEETRSTKMMLRFREEKIQRMESLICGSLPEEAYLLEENKMLSEEFHLLQSKLDKNPEVTRFALENIRLSDQLKRYQEFYEEGEREILMDEISRLRDQLLHFNNGNSDQIGYPTSIQSQDIQSFDKEYGSLQSELKRTLTELEECKCKLDICLQENAKLNKDMSNLQSSLNVLESRPDDQNLHIISKKGLTQGHNLERTDSTRTMKTDEEIMDLQLELDITKIILQEERSLHAKMEEEGKALSQDLELAKGKLLIMSRQYDHADSALKKAKSVIEALESQQSLLINEFEGLKKSNSHHISLLSEREVDGITLREKFASGEVRDQSQAEHCRSEKSTLEAKLLRMNESLEKAKKINRWYKTSCGLHSSNEEEVEKICRQAEAETAAVIVCMQEELATLQEQIQEGQFREIESKKNAEIQEMKMEELDNRVLLLTEANEALLGKLEEKDSELMMLSEEWELLASEVEGILANGHDELINASSELDFISSSFPERRIWICEQVGRMMKIISEKDILIYELGRYLEDANKKKVEMESKLMSLRGAAFAMNEAQEHAHSENERRTLNLKSLLSEKSLTINRMKDKLRDAEDLIKNTSTSATAAFVVLNNFSENQMNELTKTQEKLCELRSNLFMLRLCMNTYVKKEQHPECETKEVDGISFIDSLKGLSSNETNQHDLQFHCLESIKSQKDQPYGDLTHNLLREELEFASNFLKDVKADITKIFNKKEDECTSRDQSAENQTKESLEYEVGDAKVSAAHKAAEASHMLGKFEDAKSMMEKADAMIKELTIANGTLNLDVERLKQAEATLVTERDTLVQQVVNLKSTNLLKDVQLERLQEQFGSDLAETRDLVTGLEDCIEQMQADVEGNLSGMMSECLCVRPAILETSELIRTWLEDIWSEIIVKDSAVSALHLCQMGVLLETVSGMNVENSFLQHGLGQSNAVIASLRKQNSKSKRELETCTILKGKLLADIKNCFDKILQKEEEAEVLTGKLTAFEKRISDLQVQEKMMLQRSDYMGSELVILMKQLDFSNSNFIVSLMEQEEILKENMDRLNSHFNNSCIESWEKEIESLVLGLTLEEKVSNLGDRENELTLADTVIDELNEELIVSKVEATIQEQLLQLTIEEKVSNLGDRENELTLADTVIDELKEELIVSKVEATIQEQLLGLMLEEKVSNLSDIGNELTLADTVIDELKKELIVSKVEATIQEQLLVDQEIESTLLHEEIDRTRGELKEMQVVNDQLSQDLGRINAEYESSQCCTTAANIENQRLQERICSLENSFSCLKNDLEAQNNESSRKLQHSQAELLRKDEVLKGLLFDLSLLQESSSNTKDKLKEELIVSKVEATIQEQLLMDQEIESGHLHEEIDRTRGELREMQVVNGQLSQDLGRINAEYESSQCCSTAANIENRRLQERVCTLENSFSCLQNDLEAKNNELSSKLQRSQAELLRKDEVLKGLLFDLSLLQESASSTKDKKDEMAEMVTSLEELEEELFAKSNELDVAISYVQKLENMLQEKMDTISNLQADISKERDTCKLLMCEKHDLRANLEDAISAKGYFEEELRKSQEMAGNMETERSELAYTVGKMNDMIEFLTGNLNELACEKEQLQQEVLNLQQQLEEQQNVARKNEAIAAEAEHMAESKTKYAEDKEAEVSLLEKSIEELECTIHLLESNVEIIKGEAERQRLQREELEQELVALKDQMQNAKKTDSDWKRHLDEKQKELEEALERIQTLEREMANKQAEIATCKDHISELNLHSEAQANEYKLKFKELQVMVKQVKPETHTINAVNHSSSNSEKNAMKSRGSGSPFKCIGLGLAQQVKSEKDEDLTAASLRIEELESLAVNRQKEIFALNTRLAAAESMTHDVIRDLLGVKLDMTNYASLLDNQKLQQLADKAILNNIEPHIKEQELVKLKQQLNDFIEERQGWLEEIDRRQAELIAAQIALEKLRQHYQLLKAENEMVKMENVKFKKQVTELEGQVNQLSGQQNLHQRIHHHAKIKEENNILKLQNEELTAKLKRAETMLSRIREELAHYRASIGRGAFVDFDEERRLNLKLKEVEDNSVQLAQQFLRLCTSVLKAAGITKPQVADISPDAAENALEQIKSKFHSMEREIQNLAHKNEVANERIRLLDMVPQSSSTSRRMEGNCRSSRRASPARFLSAFDR